MSPFRVAWTPVATDVSSEWGKETGQTGKNGSSAGKSNELDATQQERVTSGGVILK
jgi:hypothetical protein